MPTPHWNPQEPRPGSYAPTSGWGPASAPPGAGWGVPGSEVSPAGSAHPAETVGLGRRLAARAIDYALVMFAAWAFFVFMAMVTTVLTLGADATDAQGGLWALLLFFGWGLLLFFYDWLYLVAWGRTIGKMAVGIRVVSAADGGRLSQGQALGRAAFFGLPQTLPLVGNLFSLAEALTIPFDTRSRALHDRAAGTVVVRVRS
ncbi:RDD family protein [Nocardiopsis sp. NPDC101807]|uniref:RDD family protein n=1 Tax=Nocardiopsis sp. NPDC101807 TaxID=3364339 RepID=UPI0037F7134C